MNLSWKASLRDAVSKICLLIVCGWAAECVCEVTCAAIRKDYDSKQRQPQKTGNDCRTGDFAPLRIPAFDH